MSPLLVAVKQRNSLYPCLGLSGVGLLVLPTVLLSLPIGYVGIELGKAGWPTVFNLVWRPRILELLINTIQLSASVTLPNILPGIGAGVSLIFLELMRELTATLILAPNGIDTLAMEVWAHTNNMEYAAAAPYAAVFRRIGLARASVYTSFSRTLSVSVTQMRMSA